MVGPNPNPYLSEEARLQAQRRMLSERYGLSMSDDDDDDDGDDTAPAASAGASKAADRASAKSTPVKRASPPEDANGRTRTSSSSSAGSRSTDAASAAVPDDRVSGAGARALEGGAEFGAEKSDKKDAAKNALAQPWLAVAANAVAPVWPGVVLADAENAHLVPRVYSYSRSEQRDAVAKRSLRVTQVTVYASQFVESDGRKIAVNDRVITYAVGGHIRAIIRNSSVLALLKGHLSAVIDTEFLSATEKRLGPGAWAGCSVLGSVAEDGYAYVWRLLRNDGEENSFRVADAIPISHSKLTEGGKYSRIAFRPGAGSVVADNGVGVAVCLVDLTSPDLRLVEMVKMDAEVMVRDKYLRGADELRVGGTAPLGDNVPVSACTWMDEHIVAVSRGENVHMWKFEMGTCAGKLPRTAKTKVHSLHTIDQNVLLVAVDGGRTIELWTLGNFMDPAPVVRLNQTVHLCKRKAGSPASKSEGFHGVVAMDPQKEIIVMANAKGNFLFAMHYNQEAKAIDAITEIPMKYPVLSISVTRNSRSVVEDVSVGTAESVSVDELGLWCVQPKGIQMVHLNPKDCAPNVDVSRQISLSPSVYQTPKNASTNKSEPPPVRKPGATFKLPGSDESARKPSGVYKLPATEETPQRPPLQPDTAPRTIPVMPIPKKRDVAWSKEDPNIAASSRTDAAKGKDGEDIAEAVLEATKKVIEAFEKSAEERDRAENARVEKLIAKVKADAEVNLETFVNNAMKKPMGDAIIPAVSKIVMDMHARVRTVDAQRAKVSEELFAHAIQQSNLGKIFKSGCDEIVKQITIAVDKSVASKCTRLVNPAIKHVTGRSKNLADTVNEFAKSLEKANISAASRGAVVAERVDVRAEAEALIKAEKINDAFLVVLNEENLELVNWLCAQFDPKTFFETNTLSQTAALSLAHQLGQGLGAGDTMNTVAWLRELVLVLEPSDEEIVDTVSQALTELQAKVGVVQKQSKLLREHAGLAKQLKTLSLVITSLTR